MGSQQSKITQTLQLNHPNFLNCQVIQKNNKNYIRTKLISNKDDFLKWENNINKQQNLYQSCHFVLLPHEYKFETQAFCGNSGRVTIDYDYFPYILSEQIQRRKVKQIHFKQSDLWYLLYSLAAAKHQLINYGSNIADISPQNIFISQEGQVKLASYYSFPCQKNQHEKSNNFAQTFCASQNFQVLQRPQNTTQFDQSQQIFSIGLTIISAALLEHSPKVQDVKKLVFSQQKLKAFIDKWKITKNFSQIFKIIICNLVEFSQRQRLSAIQLWQFVSQYESNIKSKQKFIINNLPFKIQNTLKKNNKIRNNFKNFNLK